MIYKLFIEGRIGKTLFCGYLVRNPQKIRGFFMEISKTPEMYPGFLRQMLLRKAYETRDRKRLPFGIE